jgi:hypothetical protein
MLLGENEIAMLELEQLVEKSRELREEDFYTIFTIHEVQNIATVLNIIPKLQKENEEKDKQIKDLQSRKDNQEKRFKKYKENIDKQHKEIYENLVSEKEKYMYLYQKALDNTVKSDKENIDLKKQIDLMVERIYQAYFNEDNFWKWFGNIIEMSSEKDYLKTIKQYFEKLVKEKG